MVSISYVLAAAFAMIFFAILANFVVVQYASGAVRAALDEGVRNGARADAGALVCQATIQDVLASLLGGPYGTEVETPARTPVTSSWRWRPPHFAALPRSFPTSPSTSRPSLPRSATSSR